MIRKVHTVKINLPGGVLPVNILKIILTAAGQAKIEEVRFGTRQQMYLLVQDSFLEAFILEMHLNDLVFEENEALFPNIMSSNVTQGIFQNSDWITGKVYKEILDSNTYTHTLKVNIVDSEQSLIPFFTGNINFITAELPDHWFLYVRFPKTDVIYRWKHLIASGDIMKLAKATEEVILQNRELFYEQPSIDGDLLFEKVSQHQTFSPQTIEQELETPDFRLPYYEGFNQYGTKLWLGIYRREEMFPLAFLMDLCDVCVHSRIGYLYITPWKSIIFKDIQLKGRKLWENILGKYRINVRHASNELNWQVADLSEEGLNLKRYLIRQFDKDDVRTFGLSFAVEINFKTGLFASVIIYKCPNNSSNQRRSLDRYDILYTKNFDPNSKEYILYRKDLLKEHLGTYLVSLCKFYYDEQMNRPATAVTPVLREEVEK
jgi:hypothetical protein